ncbi:MAG: decaprenyl-phosphate phosphoribosyltransferase [Myxococcales bacterium]|nr:decaprenyl-phosphate phosphoribosyltransferase [Myxococcales bacterium]MCB9582199.1 decaprenyl-phosphate phosphoribosyltransferase [Polyangiaceae bacterium]
MASPQLEEDRQSGIHPPVREAGPPPPRAEGSLLWRVGGVVKTVRPHQWVKNVFVLAPVVFAKEIFDPVLLVRAGGAFLVFCLLAGAVYTMNDIADVESDREHPVKRYRPIASGRVPMGFARGLVVALVAVSLVGASASSFKYMAVAGAYFILNVAYSSKLKHVAYLDVGCISAGFVLRVVGGGFATHISVSSYLLLCTALLALFLGFGKRRHELTGSAERAGKQRAALESYTKGGLDVALGITGLATIAVYIAYTLDPRTQAFFKTEWLWPSTLFVALGVYRFLHLVRSRPKSESPTQEMLKDGPFVGIVLLWVVLVLWVVYHLRPS